MKKNIWNFASKAAENAESKDNREGDPLKGLYMLHEL
jgi:hypothetical protein